MSEQFNQFTKLNKQKCKSKTKCDSKHDKHDNNESKKHDNKSQKLNCPPKIESVSFFSPTVTITGCNLENVSICVSTGTNADGKTSTPRSIPVTNVFTSCTLIRFDLETIPEAGTALTIMITARQKCFKDPPQSACTSISIPAGGVEVECPDITSGDVEFGPGGTVESITLEGTGFDPNAAFTGLSVVNSSSQIVVLTIPPGTPGYTVTPTTITITPPAIPDDTQFPFSAFVSNCCMDGFNFFDL